MAKFLNNFKNLKLLLLDVDGVLTNGFKYYDQTGLCKLKTFSDLDFTAIKRFRASGVVVAWISGDKNINEEIAKNRKIPFWYTRGKDKTEFLPEIYEKFNLNSSSLTAFVGDDLFDLNIMKTVHFSFCPKDTCNTVMNFCNINKTSLVLNRSPGEGVIDELYEIFLQNDGYEADMKKVYILDKNEKF